MEGKSLKEQEELLEQLEEKNIYYRLKRWEIKIFKYLKNLFYKDQNIKEHFEKMEKQKIEFNQEIKKENTIYERLSQKIEEEKKREICRIEEEKNKTIEKKEKEYNDLISYLESIKDDKKKIIEFFQKTSVIL